MDIPFIDQRSIDEPLLPEFSEVLRRVVGRGRYVGGGEVEAFEREFASWLRVGFAVGARSGSDALLLALKALGIGSGARVAVPALSGISLPQAVALAGAEPVFVDVEPETLTMDPGALSETVRYTGRVKAVVVDHLFGRPAMVEEIKEVAEKAGLPVVETAFHALGTRVGDRFAGTVGTLGCFSFHPARNLGALGEAGAVVSDDDLLAARVRMLSEFGRVSPYRHSEVGVSAAMDALQAAFLRVKLRRLAEWNVKRAEAAEYYRRKIIERGLAAVLQPPPEAGSGKAVFNHFVCRAARRDELREFLAGRGIETEIFYPVPPHLQECFDWLGYKAGDFPEAEKAAGSLLGLPFHPAISRTEQDNVVEGLVLFFRRRP